MAKGVASEQSVTKFGAKSNPGKGHSFKWEDGPGNGVGQCRHCSVKLKFEPRGERGGKTRRYYVKGKWSPTEAPCKRSKS